MTQDDARIELAFRCAADVYPVLSADELDAILATVRIVDSSGYAPSDDAYTGTWDMTRAAVAGWRRKAGKASADTDFQNQQGAISQSQVIANCLRMADAEARHLVGSLVGYGAETIDGVPV